MVPLFGTTLDGILQYAARAQQDLRTDRCMFMQQPSYAPGRDMPPLRGKSTPNIGFPKQ